MRIQSRGPLGAPAMAAHASPSWELAPCCGLSASDRRLSRSLRSDGRSASVPSPARFAICGLSRLWLGRLELFSWQGLFLSKKAFFPWQSMCTLVRRNLLLLSAWPA